MTKRIIHLNELVTILYYLFHKSVNNISNKFNGLMWNTINHFIDYRLISRNQDELMVRWWKKIRWWKKMWNRNTQAHTYIFID